MNWFIFLILFGKIEDLFVNPTLDQVIKNRGVKCSDGHRRMKYEFLLIKFIKKIDTRIGSG